MQLASQTGDPDQKMPPSIYAALIDSLFQDPGPLFAGALCAAVGAIMTAVKTGNPWLWPCVALLVVTGAVRALDTRQYRQRNSGLTSNEAARWEVRYQFGAMLYAAALGLWCVVTLLGSSDAVAHMICTSVTLCYVAAGGGRTYGRPWIFHVQMLLACGPLTLALALYGSPYYFGMAVLNVLFFLALKHISTSLQKIFVRALVAREREAALASQFDTALNNMPHGLCMFRASGRSVAWTFQPMAGGGTVVLVEDITERKNAEARISHLARYDELTALPNRVNFRDEIERLLAISHSAERLSALLFVDLDQFKQVNDTLGHPCGDQLLCAVADRLREMLRPEDFVARFGGDEFVVFQQNIAANEDAAGLARRIVDRLSERYKIDNHLVEIGASVGIAMTSPAGISADTLLKNADMALYRAKADGRGTFCFFRDEMAQTVEARRILELDLRKALANEEFELFYQPLVNLKSGRISTCEALLRWNHPVRGTVSPVDIIPVAEDMGLIVDLGRWILRKACMECMKWPQGVSVAVNFSPQQFHQRDVLSEVRYALEVSWFPAHRLEIEITESSLLRNTQLTHDVLSQLHMIGVRISLDDFGTGYSSLSYLHNFPLQKVKIDRSFLEGIDSDRPLTLLRGVARLSADLGMSVVVEGIETNEQLELISADGTVTEAQGYLFSRPVPAVRVRQLLNASHGRRQDEGLFAVPARSIA